MNQKWVELNGKLSDAMFYIDALKEDIASRDAEIARLHAQLVERDVKLDRLQRVVESMQSVISDVYNI